MNFPTDLRYTKDHEWISLNGDTATIGITDFAQQELGDIVYVEIETVGKTLDADAVFGSVEAVKTVSDLFLPVAGTITELNSDLAATPEPDGCSSIQRDGRLAIITSIRRSPHARIFLCVKTVITPYFCFIFRTYAGLSETIFFL